VRIERNVLDARGYSTCQDCRAVVADTGYTPLDVLQNTFLACGCRSPASGSVALTAGGVTNGLVAGNLLLGPGGEPTGKGFSDGSYGVSRTRLTFRNNYFEGFEVAFEEGPWSTYAALLEWNLFSGNALAYRAYPHFPTAASSSVTQTALALDPTLGDGDPLLTEAGCAAGAGARLELRTRPEVPYYVFVDGRDAASQGDYVLTARLSPCAAPAGGEDVCFDTVDNDRDGQTDCDDPECARDATCGAEVCGNGGDDDGDAAMDCDDEDCAGDAACPAPELCDNGLDDDADGDFDCEDVECAGALACAHTCEAPGVLRLPARRRGSTAGLSAASRGSCDDTGGGAPEAVWAFGVPAVTPVCIEVAAAGFAPVLYVREGGCAARGAMGRLENHDNRVGRCTFVDREALDLRPAPGSACLDAGNVGAGVFDPALFRSPAGVLTTDAAGAPRTVDLPEVANRAGSDGTDIGPWERQP
jgi:hypothetical protein